MMDNEFIEIAKAILEALGGAANVSELDNCITRLRITLYDPQKSDDAKIKSTGVIGIMRPTKNSIQIIVGKQLHNVADAMKALMQQKE